MSPTLELDRRETDFADWAEEINPLCIEPEDFQVEAWRAEREYIKTLELPEATEGRVLHSDLLAWDEFSWEHSTRAKYFRGTDEIRYVLRAAHSLTMLRDNWDDEGSQGYSVQTWKRIRSFLLNHASLSERQFRQKLPVPQINPADQGSIDVFWRLADRQLL